MQNEDALLDGLLSQKTNRPAAGVFGGVDAWFKQTFGTSLPVKNLGASDFERKAGWEHSRAFDVGLNPNSSQGQQLLKYLDSQGIPYSAFAGAVSQGGRTIATGPHIHVGPPSHRIESAQSADDTILDQMGASPDDKILDQLTPVVKRPGDRRGAYGQHAAEARSGRNPALEKLARDIEWHFGYGVLQALPTLAPEKQQQIIELAHQYAQADEAKKKTGALITKSSAWQLRNQQLVGAVEGRDVEARTPPDVDAAQKAAFRAGANPLMHLPNSVRLAAETLISGAGGLMEAGAGLADAVPTDPFVRASRKDGHSTVGEFLSRHGRQAKEMAAESQEASGRRKGTRIAQGVGSGVIEFAPLALIPELGLETVMARIGAAAVTGGAYSGLMASGRGDEAKGVLKEAAVGGATFGLMGVPLPGKSQLTRALSNLVITGGGATVINRATGASWEDSATQGLVLTLLRAPELIGKVKIRDEKGGERPATIRDIKGLLPAARFEVETARPVPTSPQTINLPAKQTGRALRVEPGQEELFSVARPGAEAGRADAPGFNPTPLTLEQYAYSKGLDPDTPLAQNLHQEYLNRVKATAGQPANAPPKYAQWAKEAEEAQAEWDRRKASGTKSSTNVEKNVQEAIANARANGPTPEFRAFFGGIEPRLAGTTIAKVAAFARKLGISFEPSGEWIRAEKDAPPFTASQPAGATGPSRGGLGAAPEGTAETPLPGMEPETSPKRTQANVGGVPQPMQDLFVFAGPAGERVPIFDSRTETPQAALVRLTQLRADPTIWNQMSSADRASVGRSLATLRSGKTPAQILDEAALSQQYPGVIRMSEETARANLKTLQDIKASETWKGLSKEQKAAIETQIKRLEEQGAGSLPEKPAAKAPERGVRWTTREQLEASPEKLRLMQKEGKVSRETPQVENPQSFSTPPAPGQEGSATLDAISGGLLRKLNTIRQTIVTAARTRSVRDVMAYSRDAGDNNAMIFGRQMRRDVEGPLREALGRRPPREAQDALSFVIESKGDPAALATMRATITASTTATPGWRTRALRALDYADANYAQLQPIAQRYGTITDAQVVHENSAGVDTIRREGYVMHAQDIEGPETGLFAGGAGTGESSAFKKVRTHETFADSIAAGVNPRTLNALDLLESRISRGQRLINRRAWVSDLRGVNDTRTGKSIMADPIIVKRVDGSTYPQPPQGYSLEYNGFEPIAVHNGYEGIYTALTDPSFFAKNAATRGFMKANATGKSISLMLDTFHLGRLALWQSMIKALGVKSFKAPFPTYRRGLTLLDSTVPEINRMAQQGEIPQEWTTNLIENKRKIDLLVERGFNVGGISDALYQDLIHAVPIVGDFNKWLFSQFQRGAMTEVGLLEFERRRAARPQESEADAARFVAKDLNTRFGNLGRQGIFKSRTGQDIARSLALAPQWNEGLIRSELGAVKQAGQMAVDLARGRRIYSGVLLRSVGGMAVAQFAANQIINYITRGHPTWENEEEGWGSKVSAFIPDKLGGGPGFFLHPMGLAAETMHLLMKGYERTEDFSQSLNEYLRSRASTAMRPALVFMTRRDYLGRSLKPGTVWGETVNAAIPAPIPGRAIYEAGRQVATGKHSEQFPGQFQKQLMSSFGVRTEPVPSGEHRIRNLASAFNRIHGIEKSGEFYESPYQKLTQSLSHGGDREALDELLQAKKKIDILKYYTTRIDHPLTGSAAREREFMKTLNEEQRKQYVASKERRREDLRVVRKLFESK